MKATGALKKAEIIIYGEGEVETSVPCSINPSQYAIKNSVNYKEAASLGTDVSSLVFLSGTKDELSLTLYFDSEYDQMQNDKKEVVKRKEDSSLPAVTESMEKIKKAMKVDGQLHRPPLVSFRWGNLDFKGVITSMTETFTMFNIFGKPIRGKMDLTIRAQEAADFTRKAQPLESPDRTKCKTITEGMSLWSIAYEEYGDCEKWRVIAKANQLMSPLDIQAGQVLRIPAL